MRDKDRSSETSRRLAIIYASDESDSGDGEKRSDSRYILKAELMWIPVGLKWDIREMSMMTSQFWPSELLERVELLFTQMGEADVCVCRFVYIGEVMMD